MKDIYLWTALLALGSTSKVIPPLWYKGGLMDPLPPPPLGFRYVTIFWKDFTFSRKPVTCSTKLGRNYGMPRCRGVCYVIQDGHYIGRHLGFFRKLEIDKNRDKLEFVNAGHVEYHLSKHSAAFCWHSLQVSPKKGKKQEFFLKNGLTTCYVWHHIS